MFVRSLYLTVLAYVSCLITAQQELLRNPGFENGVNDWGHGGFNMYPEYNDVHGGGVSVKCSGRTQAYQGPSQDVNVKPGGRYSFRSFVKLISGPQTSSPQPTQVKIRYTWTDGSKMYFEVASRRFTTPNQGWVELSADFVTPNRAYSSANLYFEGPAGGVEFYFDDVSLKELPEITNWENEANQRIETLRKSNIHVDVNVPDSLNANDIILQIDHVRHLFGFGSMVRSDFMIDPDFTQYQNIVYHMFNWATNGDYKWRYDRGTKDNPDYNFATKSTEALVAHGLKVRGHCMFWAVPGHEPNWVTPLKGTDLRNAVDNHLNYMVGITKGKLAHWDVNNELVHGQFFESGSGDPDFTKHMFRSLHAADPGPDLFLNDYEVVAGGAQTYAYLDQIKEFQAANVGLSGVGVQSHLKGFMEPDVTVLKARLDLLAQPGFPIWITELDLSADNEQDRANWYEKVLRLYFSHPAVEGIIFWGFWDHNMDPLKALVHGYTYSLDEAGKRYLHLTKEEWSTHVNRSLSSGTSFDMRGFQGDYNVTVWYQGKPIQQTTFSVGKNDAGVAVYITSDGSAIQIPPQVDPFAHVNVDHEVNSDNLRDLGQASSNTQSAQLQCVTKWSAYSAIGDDNFVHVGCDGDDILTGCSSILKNDDYHRDGDEIRFQNGKPLCRAVDGFRSTAGIQAVARCCRLQGLTCNYRTAGPSGTGVDDQVLVPCPANTYPLGCSTWTYMSESDGSYFTNKSCIGQNDDPSAGVYSFAACCQAPNLECVTVYSTPSGQSKGDEAIVGCPAGYVITGCNVYSQYGRSSGAFIGGTGEEQCYAVNGFDKYGDEVGVQAIATCCKVS